MSSSFRFLPPRTSGGHIRAIREGDWTYAVYFGLDGSGLEYELYNIKNDLGQMTNLLHGKPTRDTKQEWARLHKILTDGAISNKFGLREFSAIQSWRSGE